MQRGVPDDLRVLKISPNFEDLGAREVVVSVHELVGDVSFEFGLQLQRDGGHHPEHAQVHLDGVQIGIVGCEFPHCGVPLGCGRGRHEPYREDILVHGTAFAPERASVHAVGNDAAQSYGVEERCHVEGEAVGCDGVDESAHGDAALGCDGVGGFVDVDDGGEVFGADYHADVCSGAGQFGDAVAVHGGHFHLLVGSHGVRYRFHNLFLRSWVHHLHCLLKYVTKTSFGYCDTMSRPLHSLCY